MFAHADWIPLGPLPSNARIDSAFYKCLLVIYSCHGHDWIALIEFKRIVIGPTSLSHLDRLSAFEE